MDLLRGWDGVPIAQYPAWKKPVQLAITGVVLTPRWLPSAEQP